MRVLFRMNQGREAAREPRRTPSTRLARGLAWVMAAGLGFFAAVGARAAGQTYEPITLPTAALNANFGQHYRPLYMDPLYTGNPNYTNLTVTGEAIFGSVPFTIPYKEPLPTFSGGSRVVPTNAESNFWLSAYSGGKQANGLQTLTIPTGFSQVPEVYALMGLWWGRPGSPMVSVRFSFQDYLGTTHTYTKPLQAGPANFSLYPPFGVLPPPGYRGTPRLP